MIIEERIVEIESLIASNELNVATKRLMDFVSDFSANRKRNREVITIRSTFNDLREDMRLYGKTNEVNNRLIRLRNQILEFLDIITDEKNNNQSGNTHEVRQNNHIPSEDISNEEVTTDNKSKNDIIFEGKGISKTYKSKSISFTLHPINLKLKLREITALVGENGNGKSTLLRIIAGDLSNSAGDIYYPYITFNKPYDSYSVKKRISYISQELPKWYGILADNLRFYASIHGITGYENEENVDFIISRLGLEKYKNATWNEISGGYKMRFSIAKSLIGRPKLLILDEPLANLDVNTQLFFLQDLRQLANSGSQPMSVIVSSQHLHEIENIADNIIFLKDGKVIYNGKLKDFGKDREENSYEIDRRVTKEELMDILENIEYNNIEDAGSYFIINTPVSITKNVLLKVLLEKKTPFNYFRDISKSTRKLFKIQL